MKHNKFSIRAAKKAFYGFKIREIYRYKSHAQIEESKYDIVVILESEFPKNVFIYKSVEYIRLNDYQKDLYDFITALPKFKVWYEWELEWKYGKYIQRLVKVNEEE